MDNFVYKYEQTINNGKNNQLSWVDDIAGASQIGGSDIDNSMNSGNYTYDPIGQLISDTDEGITNIAWTVTNKVEDIYYGSTKQIHFDYNAMGNRIAKHVTTSGVTNSTYYVLDAQGNTMSVYEYASNEEKLYLSEVNLYGSSRIGSEYPQKEMVLNPGTYGSNYKISMKIGDKRFELSNHLGNVLEVLNDHKIATQNGSTGTTAYFMADVISFSDYEPFGMLLPGRHSGTETRFGFQGQEGDSEIKGEGNSYTTEFRQYDPRLGRWLSLDPLMYKFPWQSPYVAFNNNPIYYTDPKGDDPPEKVLSSPVGNAPITSKFLDTRTCAQCSQTHGGTDYRVKVGTDVKATAPGTVVRSNWSSSYGNVIVVDHGTIEDGVTHVYTLYAHNSKLLYQKGESVNTEDVIAKSGNTGNSTGPHLHYEVVVTKFTPDQQGFYGNLKIRRSPEELAGLLNAENEPIPADTEIKDLEEVRVVAAKSTNPTAGRLPLKKLEPIETGQGEKEIIETN